ncbi:MAG: hypothetical protein ACLUIQ_08255 [Dialister invisus]
MNRRASFLACVLVPAVLSGTGAMQYFFVRENGGRGLREKRKVFGTSDARYLPSGQTGIIRFPSLYGESMIIMPGQSAETISSRNVC